MRIGIDLGGTSVSVGLVDDNYKVVRRSGTRTAGSPDEKTLVSKIITAVKDLMKKSGVKWSEIESIGIGSPGSIDIQQGVVRRAGNLPFRQTPLVRHLTEAFNKKVYIDNDANCAVWGEYHAGVAKGSCNVVMVTLGTGIGGGIIINGELIHGNNNRAGEIGHMVMDINGKRCACGKIGCWETLASTKSLIERVKTEVESAPYSILGNVVSDNKGIIDGRTLFIALREGCGIARSIFNDYTKLLCLGTANIISILQPDILVFGGGISKEGDTLLNPIRECIGECTTRIEVSSLNDQAGIIGAALLHLIKRD